MFIILYVSYYNENVFMLGYISLYLITYKLNIFVTYTISKFIF